MQDSELKTPASDVPGRAAGLLRQRRTWAVGVVGLAIVGVVVGWMVARDGSPSSSPQSTPFVNPVPPVGLSAGGLHTLAGAVGQPIYWVGPKPDYLYELTRTPEGNVFIRYLPPNVDVGAKSAKYLVVATYPFRNAYAALQQAADGRELQIPGGGIASVDRAHPTSVYVAYPGVDYQIEVYDPSPARSLQVARSGEVRPVQ
jgi:hypothetical protein